MELEGEQLQREQQSAARIRVGEGPSTSSSVYAVRFSPKLALTKIVVDSLVWRQFQRTVECRTIVERKEIDNPEESTERHLPLIVSYPLTESLQRHITKAMRRRRRREQEASPKESAKQLSVGKKVHQKKSAFQKKLLIPRRRHSQRTGPPTTPTDKETIHTVESSDPVVLDQARRVGSVREEELEVQPDAITCPYQPSKKRKISIASKADFLEESSEETELEPPHLSLLPSQTSTPGSPLQYEGATYNTASREDADQREECKSFKQKCEEDSNSNGANVVAEPEETSQGLEATGSLSIVSESQIEIQTEMDVLTSSADMVSDKSSLAAPPEPVPHPASLEPVPQPVPEQTENPKWNIVLSNDDFDTVVDQLTMSGSSSQENEEDSVKEETMLAGSSTSGTEGQGVAPAKTKMKLTIRRPRKCTSTKRLSETDNQSGSRRRRKKLPETDKQSDSGRNKKNSVADEGLKESASKPRRTKKKKEEGKEQHVSPPEPSSRESANKSNVTSPPKKKSHNAGPGKQLVLHINRSVTTEDNETSGERPKGRSKKQKPNVEDQSSEPKLSMASCEKKPKGRPRKHKSEEDEPSNGCSESLATSEKKPKGRPRKYKREEAQPSNEKKPKGRPRKRKREEAQPSNEKKPKGRPRKRKREEDDPSNGCGELSTSNEKKKLGRPRKRKCVADKPPSEYSESKLSPADIELEHQVSEDSGYPSSSINSRSPTDCVLTSPIILKSSADFLQEESFQENSSPILRDSNFGICKSETDGVSDIIGSQGLEASQGETETDYCLLLRGMQPGFGENVGMEPVPSASQNLFQELDLLLSQDANLFDFDRSSSIKLESSSEMDEILRSPSVSSCLKDLQLSGALPCSDSPQPDQQSNTVQPPDFNETVTASDIRSVESDQLVSDPLAVQSSVESDQLGSSTNVSGDSTTSGVDSNCTQKGTVVNSSRCKRKPDLPTHPPSVQSKSGRRLKRTWKLCSDVDTDLGRAIKLSTEDVCKNVVPEKNIPDTEEETNSDNSKNALGSSHPELSSTNVPLSAGTGKVSCDPTVDDTPAKGDSSAVNSMDKLFVDLLSTSVSREVHEVKDRNPSDKSPLTGSTLRNENTRSSDKGTNQLESTDCVRSSVAELLRAPLRKFKLKLKRHCVKPPNQSCSHGSRPDNEVVELHVPSSKDPAVVIDINEPLPVINTVYSCVKESVDGDTMEESLPDEELNSASVVTSLEESESGGGENMSKEEKGVSAGENNPHQVFTFNGLIPSEKLSLFGGKKISGGGGGMFSGRIGSIFAGSDPSQTVTNGSTYAVPHIANTETTNLKYHPNSTGGLQSTSTPSASRKQKSNLPHSSSLSMSLDSILKEMGEVKDNSSIAPVSNKEKTCRASDFKFSIPARKAPKLPEPANIGTACFKKGKTLFGEIQYNSPSAYRASLANSAISDLILAPLNVSETLDEELKGESLFASNLTDSDVKDDHQPTDALLTTCKEVQDGVTHGETEEDASQLSFEELDEACDSKDKEPDVPPVVQNHERDGIVVSKRFETKLFKEPASPPVIKKIHLSIGEKEGNELEEEEDCISLFPHDDDDLFGGDIDEEPLTNFFAKCTKVTKSTGTGVTNQTQIKKRSWEFRQGHSPPPLDGGGFESSFVPARMPYKSHQVSRWVADQQKRMKVTPSQSSRPMHQVLTSSSGRLPLIRLSLRGGGLLNPWGPSSGGNSHGVPHGNAAPIQDSASAAPGAFLATNLPQGRSTSSQESESCYNTTPGWPTGAASNRQYCKYFLLQRCCPLRACRFPHCPRERVPPHIVEEMVFRQPLEKISVDELKPYVADHHSYCTLKSNFAAFVDIMKSLIEKRFAVAVGNIVDLITSSGVKFSTAFLCRLMENCALHSLPPSAPITPNMTSIAETLLTAIEEARGHLISEDYHFYMNTLINFKATQQLSVAYHAMKARHICPSTSTLFVLLRFIKSLDESVFPQLLDDVRKCQFNPVEKASYVSRLVECVDSQLLEYHSAALGKWLAETSSDITMKLSSRCCEHLYVIFKKKGQWNCVVELFASCNRYVHELGARVCEPLATALQQLGPITKLISIAETLTEDQMARMSSEFWDTVLQECAKTGKSQRTSIIYTALYRQKKQLSKETVSALIWMYLGQHNQSAAISLFMESLQHGYSLEPPDQLLTSVCEAMEKTKATYNLYTVVKKLIDRGISPPAAVLQSILTLCIAEKQFIKLADIIKVAVGKGVLLVRAFCQKALVELRHWGRDPDAISAAYKSLRKLDEGSVDTTSTITAPNTCTKVNHTLKKTINICRRSSVNIPVACPSPPPPPPPTLPRSTSLTIEVNEGQSSSAHETVPHEKPEILNLIEENGCRGQFGAVASILINLPDSSEKYSKNTVYSVWKGLVSTDQRAANCFSTLLESLDQHRAAKSHAVSDRHKPGSSLLPSDRWLISQVGIALLKGCDQHQDWQSGFILLHNLHLHGIHYVKLSRPNSSLPPFMLRPPSPCEVALLAVKMCLKMEQINGALEVLRGCEWIKAATDEELIKRTETLCSLAEKCLEAKSLQEAWKCLDNIDCGGKVMAGFVNMVTNLHNKLLQNVLTLKETSFALNVYRNMKHYKLQCLPTVFSALLQHLCDKKQVKVAKDLCKTAISEKAYCPLVHNDLFKVVLAPGLVGLELHLLMEEHLRRLADEVDTDSMRPLSIQFCPGSRHPLEQVLSKFIKPALQATFASSNSATVSVTSLQEWCDVNCWNCCTSGGEGQSSLATVVGQKRHFSEIGEGVTDSGKVSNHNTLVPGPEHGSGSGPKTGMEPGPKAGPKPVPRPRLEAGPVSGPLPGSTSLPRVSKESAEAGTTSDDLIQQRQGKGDTWKDFKRAVCNAVMSKIKPYYKEKFKSEDDYLHFFRVLTQNCSKLYKGTNISDCCQIQSVDGKEELVLTDSVLQRVSQLVTGVLSRCQVYSRELDEELGLTSGFSSD